MDHETYLHSLAQDFELLDDRERFLHLIELGEQLEEYPQRLRRDEFEVPGCTSLVYMHARLEDGRVYYRGYAAAKAVGGYVHILVEALSGRPPQDIVADESVQRFIDEAEMNVSTRVSRANAFGSLYSFMKDQAAHLSAKSNKEF